MAITGEERAITTFDPHNPNRGDGTRAFTPAEYNWAMVKVVMRYAFGTAAFAGLIEAIYLGAAFTLLND